MGDGGEICIELLNFVHTFDRTIGKGENNMKMTKDVAQSLAKKGVEHSKKFGIPLKNKKKKQA